MNPEFWRGKSVLLTGHTGFKGAWLALLLTRLGARVRGYALPPDSDTGLFTSACVAAQIESKFGDVRDAGALGATMAEAPPQIIFHLAAQALVLPSYEAPLDTYSTNVMGTANLLEAARRVSSLQAAVIVTSDKVYENREWIWGYRENDSLGGRDPYSSSKACAEIVTAAYRASFFKARDGHAAIGIATARAGNVIGGGDWAKDRIVPDFVRATLEGRALIVRNPLSTRPWQHVLESIGGYVLLAERLTAFPKTYEGGWNFGPTADAVQPVAALADALTANWGPMASWRHESTEQAHEARSLTLDSSRAVHELGWRRRLSFPEAVRWTVEWYKAFARGEDMQGITLSQIDSYRSLPL